MSIIQQLFRSNRKKQSKKKEQTSKSPQTQANQLHPSDVPTGQHSQNEAVTYKDEEQILRTSLNSGETTSKSASSDVNKRLSDKVSHRRSSSTSARAAYVLPTATLRHSVSPNLNSYFPNGSDLPSVDKLPREMLPIVTLIHAQQARIYVEGLVKVPDNPDLSISNDSLLDLPDSWRIVSSKLSGTELSFWGMNQDGSLATTNDPEDDEVGLFKPIYANIVDAAFSLDVSRLIIKITLSLQRELQLRCANINDLKLFYSSLLLARFEYQQMQKAFTGALLSAKAVNFSDIKVLLAPENKFVKEEWTTIRFPWLNAKWLRCYISVIPGESVSFPSLKFKDKEKVNKDKPGKIEIYISSRKGKKNLLATIFNGRSCFSIYPEVPEFIDSNSLIRIEGEVLVNETLLDKLLNQDLDGLLSRSSSQTKLNKRSSTGSLSSFKNPFRSNSLTSTGHSRLRSSSVNSVESNGSSICLPANSKVCRTNFVYIIPETHHGVPDSETMIRLLIPIFNVFKLYGRPQKFLSSRDNKQSLLFGLPQLPHTQYLDSESSYQLVDLNLENSIKEKWALFDWTQVFQEMCSYRISQGIKGSGSLVDTFRDGLLYSKELADLKRFEYAEDLEFYDAEEEEQNFKQGITGNGKTSKHQRVLSQDISNNSVKMTPVNGINSDSYVSVNT
ncbi:hypothetical protein LJB42_004754 [Komagataella kurtzmanii]|nr:hypothetical protein LJB42_004754 [Komagataella kurtzmanii]